MRITIIYKGTSDENIIHVVNPAYDLNLTEQENIDAVTRNAVSYADSQNSIKGAHTIVISLDGKPDKPSS